MYLWEDLEWILRISTQVLHGVDVSIATKRSTVSLAVALVGRTVCLESTLTHDGLTNDEGWLAYNSLSSVDSLADSSYIVSVDFEYFPTECAILGSSVLVHHNSSFGKISRKSD